jgi:hypothetical protein
MIAEPTTTEQIYQRADDSIAELEQQRTELASRIGQTQDEQATLVHARETRYQGLQQSRSLFSQFEAEYIQAEQYLRLVKATVREEQALVNRVEAKNRLTEAKKELHKLEREVAETDNQDKPREEELTTNLQTLAAEQERIQQEIQGLEQAKQQAFREEGYERYTEALTTYQIVQAKVDELEQQLVLAKIEALDTHTEALESLKSWPVHRQSIARLRPLDDATIRVLRANIAYYALLEADAAKVDAPFLPSLHRGIHSDTLHSQLFLGEKISDLHHGYEVLARSNHQVGVQTARLEGIRSMLRSQRQHLEKLLSEYIAQKQGGR